MNQFRRRLLCMSPVLALSGCGKVDRLEATAQWQDVEFAFGTGVAVFDQRARVASLGFFRERPASSVVAEMKQRNSMVLAMTGNPAPFVVLALHFRQAGRADYANLIRYSVLFANMGEAPRTFNRQHDDWLKDGGIELAGDAAVGKRLMGRLRRAETTTVAGSERSYRWDLGFDTELDG